MAGYRIVSSDNDSMSIAETLLVAVSVHNGQDRWERVRLFDMAFILSHIRQQFVGMIINVAIAVHLLLFSPSTKAGTNEEGDDKRPFLS